MNSGSEKEDQPERKDSREQVSDTAKMIIAENQESQPESQNRNNEATPLAAPLAFSQDPVQNSNSNAGSKPSPVPRAAPLPLDIKDVHVLFPNAVQRFFITHMEYKITFKKGDKSLFVVRRYNDVDALRKALRMILPCVIIFPLHPKKYFVI